MDNQKGKIRLAEVQGEYVEIGPIRSRDIAKAKVLVKNKDGEIGKNEKKSN